MLLQRRGAAFWISLVLFTTGVSLADGDEKKPAAKAIESHHHEGWRFAMPKGNPAHGRAVFEKFECYSCHQIKGEDFPYPSDYDGPELSQMGPLHPTEFFAESVIHPSAVVSKQYRKPDGRSPMSTEHISRMTLQELIDLSSYLASLKPPVLAKTVEGEGRIVALVPESGEVVLDHGVIKGFMSAMTMGYKTSSRAMLKGLQLGDRVRFTVDTDKRTINKIQKLKN